MSTQSSIVKVFQGRAIRINPDNQYVCLTDMAKAAGKLYGNWYQLKATTEYLKEFEGSIGIPIDELINIDNLSANKDRGTWAHPKIAIRFAQWCSIKFAIQVDFWIDELLTSGKVEIASNQPQPLLIEQSKTVAQNVVEIQQLLSGTQPRLAQLLIDIGVNNFVEANQPGLLATSEFPNDKWHSIVSIADKMGIKTNSSTRVKLGNHVAKQGFDRVREERLCNGEMREIWCYRDNDDVRSVISEWHTSGD